MERDKINVISREIHLRLQNQRRNLWSDSCIHQDTGQIWGLPKILRQERGWAFGGWLKDWMQEVTRWSWRLEWDTAASQGFDPCPKRKWSHWKVSSKGTHMRKLEGYSVWKKKKSLQLLYRWADWERQGQKAMWSRQEQTIAWTREVCRSVTR